MNIRGYEIIRHGIDQADYFPGCGVAGTRFTHVVTGLGDTERAAFDDAMEQLFMVAENAANVGVVEELDDFSDVETSGELQFYVSIRFDGKLASTKRRRERKRLAAMPDPVPCSGCGEFDFCVCASLTNANKEA